MVLVETLFHELVHAKNNFYGRNKRLVKSVDPIFSNLEEYNAIWLENVFLRELGIKPLRWGHCGPGHPLQQKILGLKTFPHPCYGLQKSYEGYRVLSREQKHFLVYKIPQMIASFEMPRIGGHLG